jgi:hypothetical protein
MKENIDRHALAGFVCVDAITSSSVLSPLLVTGTQLGLRRNRSGVFAVMDAPGVDRNKTQLLTPDPASWPPPTTYKITIQDPALRYLPRVAAIQAPQPLPPIITSGVPVVPPPTTTPPATTTPQVTTTPQPTTTPQAAAPQLPPVTTPQTIVLYPTPAAPVAPNWAVVRVAVVNNATPPLPLAGAVVQALTATGVTNGFGEALLAVPGLGLKPSGNSTGAVTEATTPATVTAWFNPATLKLPPGSISNPDDILTNLSSTQWKTASQTGVQLGPGLTVFVRLTISVT